LAAESSVTSAAVAMCSVAEPSVASAACASDTSLNWMVPAVPPVMTSVSVWITRYRPLPSRSTVVLGATAVGARSITSPRIAVPAEAATETASANSSLSSISMIQVPFVVMGLDAVFGGQQLIDAAAGDSVEGQHHLAGHVLDR